MRRLLVFVCMAAMVAVLGGCGSEGEDAVETTTAAFDKLADRLAEITTREQLAAAQSDLKEIGEEIKAAMKQMTILSRLPDAENKAIAEKLGRQMVAARQRSVAEMERIATIDPMAKERIADMLGVE